VRVIDGAGNVSPDDLIDDQAFQIVVSRSFANTTDGSDLARMSGSLVEMDSDNTLNAASATLPTPAEPRQGLAGSEYMIRLDGGDDDEVLEVMNSGAIVQGGGVDTLAPMDTGQSLELNNVGDIEKIDLGAVGHDTLNVSLRSVLDIPDATPRMLPVAGDGTANLTAAAEFGHQDGDTQAIDGVPFDGYHEGLGVDVATLLLQQTLLLAQDH
jgi:hypothetical protein